MDKKSGKVPIWLRRLDLVARQLREEKSFPAKAEERIHMALSLMAEGLACLYERAGARRISLRAGERNRRGRKGVTIARVRDQMAAFRSLDAGWIRRWRRERG